MGDLTLEGAGKARLVYLVVADMAVEVAIGAFGRTERPVQVDAEAGFAVIAIDCVVIERAACQLESPVSTNSRKARARWESAPPSCGPPTDFSSAVISANVLSWPRGLKTGS